MIGRRCLAAVFLIAVVLGVAMPAVAAETTATSPAASQTATASSAAELVLQKGDRLAILGDSITEQKIYSRYLEDYLTVCTPELEIWVVQLGWGGETAAGFLKRMDMDLLPLKPTIITTCYGMNDGGYKAYQDSTGQAYAQAMRELVQRAQEAGIRVVLGSPGAVDTEYFRGNPFLGPLSAATYNDTLARLGELDRQIAQDHGLVFADVHGPMMKAMSVAKAGDGPKYAVCGKDGVHPGFNGHLVMAYAMLKAMGLDGQIATITVDLAGGSAQASEGHEILSAAGGKVDIESRRYPFCFIGDPKAPDSTLSILPSMTLSFLTFNGDLNRFVLVVHGLKTNRATVAWGSASKSFSRQELEQGVNLADDFAGQTPFQKPFETIDKLVAHKQAYETTMIKVLNHAAVEFRSALAGDQEGLASFDASMGKVLARHDAMQAEIRAAVTPVRHTITIIPE